MVTIAARNETVMIKSSFMKSKSFKFTALYTPNKHTASNTGIPDKRENVILNFLLIPRKRIAVITVPERLMPGIKASI